MDCFDAVANSETKWASSADIIFALQRVHDESGGVLLFQTDIVNNQLSITWTSANAYERADFNRVTFTNEGSHCILYGKIDHPMHDGLTFALTDKVCEKLNLWKRLVEFSLQDYCYDFNVFDDSEVQLLIEAYKGTISLNEFRRRSEEHEEGPIEDEVFELLSEESVKRKRLIE